MRIYVTTSDKYIPALRPFAHLMNKYFVPNPQVVVAGFSLPSFALPDNFSFISLGKQEDYPFNRWSDALIKLLNIIDDEAFILMLEDYWITRDVDTRAVDILYHYALQFGYVLKIDLCGDRLYAFGADLNYGTVAYLDLVKSMPESPYHMSLMPGVWRRDNLLKCLIPGESPHDLEIAGSTRVSRLQDVIVLGSRQWPLRITLGLRGGDSSKINLEGLKPGDVQEMAELGYFKLWKGQ